jgi:hypothetical protein
MRPALLSATNMSPFGAARRGADNPRTGQTRGEQVHCKATRNARLLLGPVRHSDPVAYRFRRLRRRQVLLSDETAPAGRHASRRMPRVLRERLRPFAPKAAQQRGKRFRQCSMQPRDRSRGALDLPAKRMHRPAKEQSSDQDSSDAQASLHPDRGAALVAPQISTYPWPPARDATPLHGQGRDPRGGGGWGR